MAVSVTLARHLRRWLDLPSARSVAKNASWLIGGNSAAAVLQLVTLGVAARSIGAHEFGALMLLTSYTLVVEGLVSSQSWQSLIKFGAEARATKDVGALRRTIKLCGLFDVIGAALAAVLAYFGAYIFSAVMEWDEAAGALVRCYSMVLLFHVSGTPTGILRLFGDFRRLALQPVFVAGLKLLGVVCISFAEGPLWAYVLLWGLCDVTAQLWLVAAAWMTAKINDIGNVFTEPLRGHKHCIRAQTKFLLLTNLNGSIHLVVKRIDMLIVGFMLGEASAGIYRIVKMIAQVPAQVSSPFAQAVFPEIARQQAEGNWSIFRALINRMSLAAGGAFAFFWLGFLVVGYPMIPRVFGADFAGAWQAGTIYLLGIVISGFSLPLQPAVLSFGKPEMTFRAHMVSNTLYLGLLVVMLPLLGLVGAGLAFLAYYAVWSIMMFFFFKRLLQQYGAPI